jgi:SAM-dependent methyltransferase
MPGFYDDLAPLYHLIYEDWDESVARQGEQLAAIIRKRFGPEATTILDVSCGIGTQAIALASRGFKVTGSDVCAPAIERARGEAARRGLAVDFSLCDMRNVIAHHKRQFDVVISCDNSITHLLTDLDLGVAVKQLYDCVHPGGGCLLTVRDYDREPRGTGLIKPYGVRQHLNKRVVIFQVWDFDGDQYDMAMYFVFDDGSAGAQETRVMRTRYNAVGTGRLLSLLSDAGFSSVERIDGAFYQPVLVGIRERAERLPGPSLP